MANRLSHMEANLHLQTQRQSALESTERGLVAALSTAIHRLGSGQNQQDHRMLTHEQVTQSQSPSQTQV